MSRFDINKFMMFVDGHTESLERFCSDRQGFVAEWVEGAEQSLRPLPDGGPLSESERAALVAVDVGALYEMGSHPYILLHFARAVEVDVAGTPFPEFDAAYKSAVTPHGYPDFST